MIEGHKDELTPLAEAQMRSIKGRPCPRCNSSLEPHIYAPAAFTAESPLPRTLGRCSECGLILDPNTGLILDTGDPRRIEDALPIVRGGDD